MRINYLTLLATPILVLHSNFSVANPLRAGAAMPRLPTASVGDNAEPTCNPPGPLSTTSGALGNFPSDCIDAANDMFGVPVISGIAWRWKRVAPGEYPRPGYNFLPLAIAPRSCMLELDVLSDPNAEDHFALVQIAEQFTALFNKCIRPNPRGPSGGFVPVGPRQVLKLSVSPTPMGGVPGRIREKDHFRLNITTFLNESSAS